MRFHRTLIAAVVLLAATRSYAYRMSAWIPSWDASAISSIQANGAALQECNPVWYSLNADGSIAKNWNAENSTLRAAMSGSDILPTLQNVVGGSFDGTVGAQLIATDASRNAHAEAIVGLVVTNAFDGIDIDYERL